MKRKLNSGFFKQVYRLVRKIPKGKVTTYGSVARIMGTRDARKVGWALHANRDGSDVPCHRVVNRDGRLAPDYAFGGPNEQRNRLLAEGVTFIGERRVDLKRYLWQS